MSESVSRRDFLAAGAAAAGTLVAAKMYAQTSQTMKVGLIGCGGRGSGAVKDVLEADKDVHITAFCDLHESKAKTSLDSWKKRHPDRVTATPDTVFSGLDGYKKLLASPDVNYVILATPPGFRPYHLEAAVEAGKNIFTEKPVAVDVTGIRKCLEVAKKSRDKGLKVVAGTQRRHQAGYVETMKRLHDGEFGDILSARVYWNGNTPWFNARQKGMTDAQYQLHNWYHFLWLCGDHIVEQHVHNLDVANWAMGATPVKVSGMGGRSNRPAGDPKEVGNIFDHFALEYAYPNGVIVQSFCRHIDGAEGNISENFVGTKARVQTRDGQYTVNGKDLTEGRGAETKAYVQEHMDLIKAIRDDKPINELEQVTNSTFTAILGRMAAYSGRTMEWDKVLHGKELHRYVWDEDTFPKQLSLDMAELPVDPVPVVGKWRPKKRGA
jgi:myo-inositol 2-dehydrogenase / D-chiro-inositol 1-dehydrogenase